MEVVNNVIIYVAQLYTISRIFTVGEIMDFYFVLGWLTLLLVLLRVVYIFTHYKSVYKGEVERVTFVTHSGTTITNVDVRCESGLVLLLSMERSCKVKPYQACIVKKIGKNNNADYAKYYLKCNKRTYLAELLNADILKR